MVAVSPVPSIAAPADASVRVEITGLRNAKGDVGCLIFNGPDGYPETHAKALKEIQSPIDGEQAVCEFKAIVPGVYAVIVFHDENHNGKLDKNFMGIPQEGYAASNNIRPLLSAPDFKGASFIVPAAARTIIKVQVRY